jgi:iron complex outermembrane recepter protein
VSLNAHYQPAAGWARRLHIFVDVRNVTDEVYVASASNLTNTLNPATGQQNPASVLAATGGIYAGAPRAVVAGARVRF